MEDELLINLKKIKDEKDTKLLPENLKQGVTCLGIIGELSEGIDTSSDNPAIANEIAEGKEAFVNGEKLTGTARVQTDMMYANGTDGAEYEATASTVEENENLLRIDVHSTWGLGNRIIPDDLTISSFVSNNAIAKAINLTPEIIKAGVTILGITGTYSGESSVE